LSTIHHGITRMDDYAWLRAANWQAVMRDPAQLDPAIRAHLEAENAYAEAFMADTKELQAQLLAEMKGRIKEHDASVPAPDGPFAYYTCYVTGGQYPLFCRRPRDGGRSACWWTGTRWQSRALISASQASLTAPIIASLPTPWIPRAR